MRNAIRLFAPNKSVPHYAGLLHNLSIVLFLLLPVGGGLGTAAARAQTRAYVTTSGSLGNSDFVSVIDIATNTVVASIPVGFSPYQIAITPDGTRAYVTDGTPPPSPPTLSSTSVDSRELIQSLPAISVIDTATNMVVATVPVGQPTFDIAITSLGAKNIDTSGPIGRLFLTLISSIAELESDLIRERVKSGMRRAKLEGRQIGRARLDVDRQQIVLDCRGGMSLTQVAKKHAISRASVCRLMKELGRADASPSM